MKFTYNGNNGFCNTCGGKEYTQLDGQDNADHFVTDDGADLTQIDNLDTSKAGDGPGAEIGKVIFNKTNGYSKWFITGIAREITTNDRLNVSLITPGIGGQTPEFNSGDEITITKRCGVDGTVGTTNGGNDIDRRSDCDIATNWFSSSVTQQPGQSIFRRYYLKAELSMPKIHQKLNNFRADNLGPNSQQIVLIAESDAIDNLILHATGFSGIGGDAIYKAGGINTPPLPATAKFERGVWHSLQEEYRAATIASTDGNGVRTYNTDGAYRLWFSKSGFELAQGLPTFELTNLSLPPINGGMGTHISFWGNFQHHSHSVGSWYIDDVEISDAFVAPVVGTSTAGNKAPPKAPVP
jgi:hypothetical protein